MPETTMLFTPQDVQAVRLNCTGCGTSYSFPPDKWEKLPPACVNCGKQWMLDNSAESKAFQSLRDVLKTLRAMNGNRLIVQFEVKG